MSNNTQIILALVFLALVIGAVCWFWGKAYAERKAAELRTELEKKLTALEFKISQAAATKIRDILSRPKLEHNVHSIEEFIARVKKKNEPSNDSGSNGS